MGFIRYPDLEVPESMYRVYNEHMAQRLDNRRSHPGKDMDWVVSGGYLDRFERRDKAWRISDRRAVFDWDRLEEVRIPPAGVTISRSIEGALRGRTDRTDPSYQQAARSSAAPKS